MELEALPVRVRFVPIREEVVVVMGIGGKDVDTVEVLVDVVDCP